MNQVVVVVEEVSGNCTVLDYFLLQFEVAVRTRDGKGKKSIPYCTSKDVIVLDEYEGQLQLAISASRCGFQFVRLQSGWQRLG
jgi:hypothetical protein